MKPILIGIVKLEIPVVRNCPPEDGCPVQEKTNFTAFDNEGRGWCLVVRATGVIDSDTGRPIAGFWRVKNREWVRLPEIPFNPREYKEGEWESEFKNRPYQK